MKCISLLKYSVTTCILFDAIKHFFVNSESCDEFFVEKGVFVCKKFENYTMRYEKNFLAGVCNYDSNLPWEDSFEPEIRYSSLISVNCSLESAKYINCYSKFTTFTTGNQNPDTVLKDFTFSYSPHPCKFRTVILSASNIEFIERRAFACFDDLETLDLSNNRIEVLLPETFDPMRNLRNLDLSRNRMQKLEAKIFYKLKSLTNLNLDNNMLQTLEIVLPPGSIIRSLSLFNNSISSVAKDVFVETKKLYSLDFSFNELQNLTSETFGSLQSLRFLNLTQNKIRELQNGTFQNNKLLEFLYLSQNKLSTIKESDFRGLESLYRLHLGSNMIENIDFSSFDSIRGLKDLIIESNPLVSFNASKRNRAAFSELKYLSLSDTQLKNLSNVFLDIPLRVLLLSRNAQMVLSKESFADLSNLEKLYLDGCNITSLPEDLFTYTKSLKYIYMGNNSIQAIEQGTFAPLKQLIKVDLSYNKINNLRNQLFSENENLTNLDLSNNHIVDIDSKAFPESLRELNLSSNHITHFPFSELNLEELYISHNRISSLSGIIKIGTRLRKVDVSYNNISQVAKEEWREILKMEIFSATDNNIREIVITDTDDDTPGIIHLERNKVKRVQFHGRLHTSVYFLHWMRTQIYITDNALDCDCSAYQLHQYVKNSHSSHAIKFEGEWICREPLELRHMKLEDLSPTQLQCDFGDDRSNFQCASDCDCIHNCTCTYIPHDEFRAVDCSNRGFTNLPHSPPKYTNLLNMNGNDIVSLVELNESLWQNLTEIHVESNAIENSEFCIPKNVTFLGLKNNKLKIFPSSIKEHAEKTDDFKLTLSNNSWRCTCSLLPLKMFLLEHGHKVNDIEEVKCTLPNGTLQNVSTMKFIDFCPPGIEIIVKKKIPVKFYVTAALVFIAVYSIFIYYHKNKFYLLYLLYTRCKCCYNLICCVRETERDKADVAITVHFSDKNNENLDDTFRHTREDYFNRHDILRRGS